MYEYMRALHSRFYKSTEQIEHLKQEVHITHKKLSEQLDKPKRKLLLQLVDLEDTLRNEACIESFACGYKLAHGIHQELLPPYDVEEEDMQRANMMMRGEG